jgi:putative DNA primase/helicase
MPTNNSSSDSFVPISQYAAREFKWVWPGRIPRDMVTVIAGESKTGKSLLACNIAATVTTGAQFPCEEGWAKRGHVVIVNGEDDAGQILVLRLSAAGADLSRVHVPPVTWDPDDFIGWLKRELPLVPYRRVLILDPITAFFPHRNNADRVRAVLTELRVLAAKTALQS